MLEIIAFALMVAADQLTKLWAICKLKPLQTFELLPGILHLTYAENTGAAFSIFQGKTAFLIILPVIVCLAIVHYLISKRAKHALERWSLVLILSGAVGNIIDRIMRGAVVDFFEIRLFEFAIFNVADIFVTIGAVLLFVYILFIADAKDKTP